MMSAAHASRPAAAPAPPPPEGPSGPVAGAPPPVGGRCRGAAGRGAGRPRGGTVALLLAIVGSSPAAGVARAAGSAARPGAARGGAGDGSDGTLAVAGDTNPDHHDGQPDEDDPEDDDDDDDGPPDLRAERRRAAAAEAPGRLLAEDAPAPTDAPQLRNVEPVTRLYVDGGYAETPDLSALPFVLGSGSNLRMTVGGSLKLGRFQLETELPSIQSTSLFLTSVPGGMPIPEDQHQTSRAIGDWRLGAQWTDALPDAVTPAGVTLVGGFSLRARIPTHTTRFQFHLVDNSLGVYRFPYYFHVEPALLLGGAIGRFSFVLNQGALVLAGPNGNFGDLHFTVPTLYFWDAHYAVAVRLASFLSVSTELATVFQGNRITDINFQRLNGIRSVAVAPGVAVLLPRGVRLDLVGRWGLTRDADLFGVLSYSGSRSVTVRLSLLFP